MAMLQSYGIWILLSLLVWWLARHSRGSSHEHGTGGCSVGCGSCSRSDRREEDSPPSQDGF